MNRKLSLTGVNIFFLVFSIIFIFYQVVLGVILGDRLYDHLYTVVIINEFVILIFVIVYAAIKKVNLKEVFKLNSPGIIPMILIAVTAVPAYFTASALNSIVVFLLQYIGDIPAEGFPVPQNIPQLLKGIAIIGVLPGICEELMHRGILLKAYERRGSYKAVAFVAIIFGIFHFDVTNLLGPIFLGVIIGYYVVRTNSIFAGIWAHFLNNTVATILQYIWRDEPRSDIITMSPTELFSNLSLGAICFVVTVGLILLFREATRKKARIVPPISGVREDIRSILSHWPVIIVLVLYFLMALVYILSIMLMKLLNY